MPAAGRKFNMKFLTKVSGWLFLPRIVLNTVKLSVVYDILQGWCAGTATTVLLLTTARTDYIEACTDEIRQRKYWLSDRKHEHLRVDQRQKCNLGFLPPIDFPMVRLQTVLQRSWYWFAQKTLVACCLQLYCTLLSCLFRELSFICVMTFYWTYRKSCFVQLPLCSRAEFVCSPSRRRFRGLVTEMSSP